MNRTLDFKMETRPYGDGFTNMVGIECGWCHVEHWHPAKNGGWAVRIFRATGWKVGSKRSQDRCPTCFGKARAARRTPDNPVITPEVGKVIKAEINAARSKEALLGTSLLYRHPAIETITETRVRAEPVQGPLPMHDPSPPMEPQPPPAAAPEAARPHRRGSRSVPGVTKITRRDNATRAARIALGDHVQDGVEYYTMPLDDGWTWKLAADVTPEELVGWTPIHRLGPRKKKDPMKKPDPTTIANDIVAHVAEPPAPTREARGHIHDELTKVYDVVAERYFGADSDKVVAERLDVPRAWVSEVRAMFFGDHDRNQAAEKHKADLDAAIVLASGAAKRLFEMAAEAETLEQSLVSARKKLEG